MFLAFWAWLMSLEDEKKSGEDLSGKSLLMSKILTRPIVILEKERYRKFNKSQNCFKQNNHEQTWEKILFRKQGVPDNYVPESFLQDLRKNGLFIIFVSFILVEIY